jgi:N-acetylneuraminate lyase
VALRLPGLTAATFAPFHADGTLNLAIIDKQLAVLAAQGVKRVFVNGTTGEGASLTLGERLELAQRWCQAASDQMPVVVQVGSNALPECKEMAAQCERLGATAISCLPPNYFKPANCAEVVQFCREVAAAAPKTPFYYYHIPMRTGVNISLRDFFLEAQNKIATLVGAKFSHPDLMDLLRCLRLMDGKFDILFGLDEMLLPALALGVNGAVGTTYNFAAPLYQRLVKALQGGDLEAARMEQHRAAEMVACLARHDFLPAAKALMKMVGLDCGPVRSPLRPLTEEATWKLHDDLASIGFFNWRQ